MVPSLTKQEEEQQQKKTISTQQLLNRVAYPLDLLPAMGQILMGLKTWGQSLLLTCSILPQQNPQKRPPLAPPRIYLHPKHMHNNRNLHQKDAFYPLQTCRHPNS